MSFGREKSQTKPARNTADPLPPLNPPPPGFEEMIRSAPQQKPLEGHLEISVPEITIPKSDPAFPKATYKDHYGNVTDLFAEIETGNPLEPKMRKQLFHAFDLQEYGNHPPEVKQRSRKLLDDTINHIAYNEITRLPKTGKGRLNLMGQEVSANDAFDVTRKSLLHEKETDRKMTREQVFTYLKEREEARKRNSRQIMRGLEQERRSNPLKRFADATEGFAYSPLGNAISDTMASTMNAATGALKGATFGYADLTADARKAGKMLGADPSLTTEGGLGANISTGAGEFLGLGATAGGIGKAIAPVFKPLGAGWKAWTATGAADGAIYGATHRREGDLTLENQLDPAGRAQDALTDAAAGAVLGGALGKGAKKLPDLAAKLLQHSSDHPVVQKVLRKMGYGPVPPRKTEDSSSLYEQMIAKIAKEEGMSQQDLDFLSGKIDDPPATKWGMPYRRELWAPGKNNNRLENLGNHADDHAPKLGLSSDDVLGYVQEAHDFRNNLPKGTELLINKYSGQQIYYHEPTNMFLVRRKDGSIQSFYPPDHGRSWFEKQFKDGIYYGVIK